MAAEREPGRIVSARANEIALEEQVAQRLGQGLDSLVRGQLAPFGVRTEFAVTRDFQRDEFRIEIRSRRTNQDFMEAAIYAVTDETLTAHTASTGTFRDWMNVLTRLLVQRFKPLAITIPPEEVNGWTETRPARTAEWRDHVIEIDQSLESVGFQVVENSLGTAQPPPVPADEEAAAVESIRRAMA